MKYPKPVTPAELSNDIKQLCLELTGAHNIFYVRVDPSGHAINNCFENVKQHIDNHGGESIIGWSIWELPRIFIEAEFHANWKSPSGEIIDLTPKATPTQRILFLPDPIRAYQGHQVNNVRRAIGHDPAIKGYLKTFDDEYILLNRGERKNEFGTITLEDAELKEYAEIESRREHYHNEIQAIWPEIGPYTPCLCGSGKKTKWCDGTPR